VLLLGLNQLKHLLLVSCLELLMFLLQVKLSAVPQELSLALHTA